VKEFDFVSFDDPQYVTNNPQVQLGLNLDNIGWAFTANVASNYHPLTVLSHMLDVQLFGLDAKWHHIVSLLLHIVNSILLFIVLHRMTGCRWQSAFVASLFALHPLHVESVAWISERKDVLSTLFFMLTLWSYIRYSERPTLSKYTLVCLFFGLGLLAKPMLVTLPIVLLLLDYWPLCRFSSSPITKNDGYLAVTNKRLLFEKIPLLGLVFVASLMTLLAQKNAGSVISFSKLPLTGRMANAIISYVVYLRKMLWPDDLAVFYPHPGMDFNRLAAIISILLLGAVTVFCLKQRFKAPYLLVGWMWYIVTLLPVIGLVQVGGQSLADRYTYIPLIGIFVSLSWGIPYFINKWTANKVLLPVFSLLILFILIPITRIQVGYWSNSITLYNRALATTENNIFIHDLMGRFLVEQWKIQEAAEHLRKTFPINYNEPMLHKVLGTDSLMKGLTDEAIDSFKMVLRLNPDDAYAHNYLGVAYSRLGRTGDAIKEFREALRINPDYDMAKDNLNEAMGKP
jgi:tetratricopeptide (TPR) repeat protein